MFGQINHQLRRLLGNECMTMAVAMFGMFGCADAQSENAKPPDVVAIKLGKSASFGPLKQIDAGVLNIGYAEAGAADGPAVILLHGWPYDIHSFVDVAPLLASKGYRVIMPYLRGYGSTRFLSDQTLRNGQQAAVAVDINALMDALKIKKATFAGFDWGARTANIIAALWPERCKAMVSVSGYLIGTPAANKKPLPPRAELEWWYQYYFATDRGRAGYAEYRHDFAKLIWQTASPKWDFDDATFDRTAASLNNPDHVAIAIHNYRWRLGLADGERQYDDIEKRLAKAPVIAVPTITLEGDANGAPHADAASYRQRFSGKYAHRIIKGGIGHNLPQEAPEAFAQAVIDADGLASPASRENSSERAPADEAPFLQEHHKAMAKMMKNMAVTPTGDVDRDFVTMMVPHHQGAIDMAKTVLRFGKNEQVRRLAQEIIVTQQQEIAALRLAVGEPLPPSVASPATATNEKMGRGQVPGAAGDADIPVTHRDRVYAAEQFSNTVSVTDPVDNKLLGVIRLGEPQPGNFSPLYKGQVLVHGMGFSPDHRTLAVVSIGSNSVTFIDTTTNDVKHTTYVGRSPHEAFFTPDGTEVWVTVRGEDYVAVLDGKTYEEKTRIKVPAGPGMQIFSPDGKYGYVCSSFSGVTVVVSVKDHVIVGRVKQISAFSPDIAATPDGKQVWLTLKDTGKTMVFNAQPPFDVLKVLDTGPITNHVNFARNSNGQFAYVSVGGLDQVKVFRTDDFSQVATIPVGKLPHGVWPSGDGSRIYVGLENADALTAIDTTKNAVIATIPVGQAPQAITYVPGAVPHGDGLHNLQPLALAGKATHLTLSAIGRGGDAEKASTSVSLFDQGVVQVLQASVTGLEPKKSYVLATARDPKGQGKLEPLQAFATNPAGAAIVNTIGPIRQIVQSEKNSERRYLVIVEGTTEKLGKLVQVQASTAKK